MRRIFAWIVLLLVAGFVIWSTVTLIQCSSDDKMRYTSYFTVKKETKTDEYVKFSFKNKAKNRKNLNTYLLVYSLIFEVTTADKNTFEYAVKLGEAGVENDPLKINVESVPTLAPKEKLEYEVRFKEVKEYMAQNKLVGEIKTVTVKDVEFCKVEVNEQLFDEDYPEFRNYEYLNYSFDYFFNVTYVDEVVEGEPCRTFTITLNNLIDGALCYDIDAIILAVNYYGNPAPPVNVDPSYQNDGKTIIDANSVVVYTQPLGDDPNTIITIGDIEFTVIFQD